MNISKEYKILESMKRFPVLSIEEEKALTTEYFKTKNKALISKIVYGNWRFAAKAAHNFSKNNRVDFLECFQEAIAGMILALEKFDPNKNYLFPKARFSSYAKFKMVAMMQKYWFKNYSAVFNGSVENKKRFFAKLTQAEIDHLNAPNGWDYRLPPRDLSLNDALGNSEYDFGATFQDELVDCSESFEEIYFQNEEAQEKQKIIRKILKQLDPKDRKILRHRHMLNEAHTMQETGDALGISRERVRQRENRAMNQFRKIYANQEFLI